MPTPLDFYRLFITHDLVKSFILFLREVGLGLAALNKFCAVFGIKPMSESVLLYQKKQNRIIDVMVDRADTILSETVA